MIKKVLITLIVIFNIAVVFGQTDSTTTSEKSYKTRGISVSPAHFHLNMKPGEVRTYTVTVKNDIDKPTQFKVNIYDFNMNGKGKSSFIAPQTGKYSLSKWMSVSPTFIEVKPGEKKEVKFTVSVPDTEEGNKAAWSILMVEQEKPRETLEPPKKSDETVALGVIPTYAFGVFVYQNPPNVVTNNVEITNFFMEESDSTKIIKIEAENKGDGIAYCTSYIDLTNLNTGQQQRLTVKRFTILPDLTRYFSFVLSKKLPKGKYLAVGVLDYEKSEEIQAAKMEFEIK
jgi:hypothetical protein